MHCTNELSSTVLLLEMRRLQIFTEQMLLLQCWPSASCDPEASPSGVLGNGAAVVIFLQMGTSVTIPLGSFPETG